jgi:phosphoribosylformylglycinamidine synthase
LHYAIIGKVTGDGRLKYYMKGELEADVPANDLVLGGGAPVYDREYTEPSYFKEYQQFSISSVAEPERLDAVGRFLLSDPNLASKKWVYRQYDSMVGTKNMSTNHPSDAAIVNIKESNKALALTVDCNSRYVHADPYTGASIAVNEAARNLVCSGAKPIAITNCLNFGNPYNPEVYWQFVGAIKGMSKACLKFQTPVTGGNVSFYNQTAMGDRVETVFPTPTIAMIGLVDDVKHVTTLGFKAKGDLIYLIGTSRNDLASSQYLVHLQGVTASPAPYFDLDEEYLVQRQVAELIREGLIASAHDASEGGLFVALMESAMAGDLGFDLTSDGEIRPDAFLFGESQSRIVVTVHPDHDDSFVDSMMRNAVEFDLLGHVTKGSIRVDDQDWGTVEHYRDIYDNALNFSETK